MQNQKKVNNLTHQTYKINRIDFEKRNQHRGIVLWFVGLSGSGKSTIANGLQTKLFENGFNAIVLDGDNTRLGINKDLGFGYIKEFVLGKSKIFIFFLFLFY